MNEQQARKQGTMRNCLVEMSSGRAGFHALGTGNGSTITRCDFVMSGDLYAILADEPQGDLAGEIAMVIREITAKGPATRGVAVSVSGRPESVFKNSYVAQQGEKDSDLNEDADARGNRVAHEMPTGSTVENIQHTQSEDVRGTVGETSNPTSGNSSSATSDSGGKATRPVSGPT